MYFVINRYILENVTSNTPFQTAFWLLKCDIPKNRFGLCKGAFKNPRLRRLFKKYLPCWPFWTSYRSSEDVIWSEISWYVMCILEWFSTLIRPDYWNLNFLKVDFIIICGISRCPTAKNITLWYPNDTQKLNFEMKYSKSVQTFSKYILDPVTSFLAILQPRCWSLCS